MDLEAKGTIKYERGTKEPLTLKAPAIGIDEGISAIVFNATGDLPKLLEMLRDKIKDQVQQGFNRPVTVELSNYSLNCTFFVTPINNRTLDEFKGDQN